MAFKRKRVSAPMSSWGRKGKRSKRTFKKRGRSIRSGANTTQSAAGYTPGFSARKWSRRRWNSQLWTSTQQKAHYRCNYSVGTNLVTNLVPEAASVSLLNADDNGVATFWQTLGGAIDVDGGTVPLFEDDIILRGGIHKLSVCNTTAGADSARVDVFLVRSGQLFDTTGFPSTVAISWDPTLHSEFNTRIGKVIKRRTFMLANGEAGEMYCKRPIQKVDQNNWAAGRFRYFWIICCSTLGAALVQNIQTVRSSNLSFSGDSK